MDWEAVSKHLQAPLDPAAVKPPPQGKFGEYVDGFHVITEANRIFGHDGWSYRITDLRLTCNHEAKTQKGPQVRVGYLCRVVVTVDGVEREGSAVGSGMAKPDNEADAHESAVKEAETDALKRALRSFGFTFGLALYDKSKANVQAPPPDPAKESEIARDRILSGLQQTPDNIAEHVIRNSPNFQADYGKLSEPHKAQVDTALRNRKAAA